MSGFRDFADLWTCAECGLFQEAGEVGECSGCSSRQMRRGCEVLWAPWDFRGRRMAELKVPLLAVKSRRRVRTGKLDVLCEVPGGEGDRWFSVDSLLWGD